jgi:hypothetical protein
MATTIEDRVALLEAQVFELQHRMDWSDEMTTQQGLRHASFRAIGGTAGTYEGDARAAFEVEATIPAGSTFNEAFILWLQARLGSTDTNLQDLMQAFAEQEGAHNWSCLGSFDPVSGDVEVDVSVAASSDDAREAAGTVVLTGTSLLLSNGPLAGFRFDGVAVPQGATIVSASIQFTAGNTTTGDHNITVQAEDADDPGTFTTDASNISGRTLTTASVSWTQTGGVWTAGNRTALQKTNDLATVVQEIVDRVGWATGQAMVFVLARASGTVNRSLRAYDNDPGDAATLAIVYTA